MTLLSYMERRIKVANRLTLTWENYPGLSDRPNVITKFFLSKRGRQKKEPVKMMQHESYSTSHCWFRRSKQLTSQGMLAASIN